MSTRPTSTGTVYDAAGRKQDDLHAHIAVSGGPDDWTPIDDEGVALTLDQLSKIAYFYDLFERLPAIGHPKSLPSVYLPGDYVLQSFVYDGASYDERADDPSPLSLGIR